MLKLHCYKDKTSEYHFKGISVKNFKDLLSFAKEQYYHRLDGPAHIYQGNNNSVRYYDWYKNGKIHRIDGPARYATVDDRILYHEWYLHGKEYKFVNWLKRIEKVDSHLAVELKLQYADQVP